MTGSPLASAMRPAIGIIAWRPSNLLAWMPRKRAMALAVRLWQASHRGARRLVKEPKEL
jgi:hypothetical protein